MPSFLYNFGIIELDRFVIFNAYGGPGVSLFGQSERCNARYDRFNVSLISMAGSEAVTDKGDDPAGTSRTNAASVLTDTVWSECLHQVLVAALFL